jgi:hypothetical protein
MPAPAPAADQNATPVYGVRYPKTSSKANMLARDFEDIAEDFEQIMLDAGVPPVVTGTPVVAASAAARDTHWGIPATATARLALQALGAQTIRTDKGWIEQYFAGLTDGGANTAGQTPAGWYPISGKLPIVQYSAAAAIATGTAETLITGMSTAVKTNTGFWTWAAGVFTCVQSGLYHVAMSQVPSAATGGSLVLRLKKNGAVQFEAGGGAVAGTFNNVAFASEPVAFVTGDTAALYNIGSAANVGQVDPQANRISLRYLGPTP